MKKLLKNALVQALCMVALGISIAQASPKKDQNKLLKTANALAAIIRNENNAMETGVRLACIEFKFVDRSECINEVGEAISAFSDMQIAADTGNRHICIQFNPDLSNESNASQTFIIFHELAHAYDKHIWEREIARTVASDITFDCYPALKNDVEYCLKTLKPESPLMRPDEWHAEWQASQWIKKYAAEHVAELKRHRQEIKFSKDRVGIKSVEYPPTEIVLKWLS